MIVVADSGPLHYLILLEQIELLQRFYGHVLVPEPVAGELSAAGAPTLVRNWVMKPPTWVDVRPVPADAVSMIADDLDLGERAAIALAEALRADLLLIDEAAGRAEAKCSIDRDRRSTAGLLHEALRLNGQRACRPI